MKSGSSRSPAPSGKVGKTTTLSRKLNAEEAFLNAWKAGPLGKHCWRREYRFCPFRRWRLDFAFSGNIKLAVEIEGRGRHQTIKGFRDDAEKYNYAASRGWKVFRFPATDITVKNEWGEPLLDLFIELLCETLCGMIP